MPTSACELPASQAGKDGGEDGDPREQKGKGSEGEKEGEEDHRQSRGVVKRAGDGP